MLSPFILTLAAAALANALALHLLLRGGEFLERRRRISSRDIVVVPGILLIFMLGGIFAGPLGRLVDGAPADLVVAGLIGMRVGALMPRPARYGGQGRMPVWRRRS